MMKLLLAAALGALLIVNPCDSAPTRILVEKGVQVEPIYLKLKWRNEDDLNTWHNHEANAEMFFGFPRLILGTAVFYEKGKILEFSEDDIVVDKFQDNLEKSLKGNNSGFKVRPFMDRNDEVVRLYFDSKSLPGPGASALEVKGSAMVTYAQELREVVTKPIPRVRVPQGPGGGKTKGVPIKLGPWNAEVLLSAPSGTYTSLRLETKVNQRFIQEIDFIGADGKIYKARQAGHGGGSGPKSETIRYWVDGKHKEITISAKVWTKVEKKRLRFDFQTGLNLASRRVTEP